MHRDDAADAVGAADAAARSGEDITALLGIAESCGRDLPLPGSGATAQRWDVLRAVARVNVTAARVLEAHTDALAIVAEAGHELPSGTWGVFAAEAPGRRLDVHAAPDATTTVTGTKPWCSLADRLDHALITAWDGDRRRLYRVDLRQPSVQVHPATAWAARGLAAVTSTAVDFDAAPVEPVGAHGWYLDRPGFAWGGIGVAACWAGAAEGIGADVLRKLRDRPDDDLLAMHAGVIDVALTTADHALAAAAADVDGGRADGDAGALLALRVRSIVADACEQVLRTSAHALGPTPLAFDHAHAARVADLQMYVRQHHAERDLAALGRAVAKGEGR